MFDSKFAETLIDAAMSYGVDAAEIYYSRSANTEIMAVDGKAEMVNVNEDDGYAVRLLKDSRMSFGSSNLIDKKHALGMVRDLAKRCELHSTDESNVIPVPMEADALAVDEPFDERMASTPLKSKVDKLLGVEESAKAFDSRITGFGWLQYGDSVQESAVFNSNGVVAESRGTIVYVFAYAIANDGKSVQTGTHVEASGHFDSLDVQSVGGTVAKHAVRMLGASGLKTGEYKLVLPPETSSAFLASLASMLSGDHIQKGKSPLCGRMGEFIASRNVTIVDDGLLPGGLGTSRFDAEGNPSRTTVVVDEGKMVSYLCDSYCARKGGTQSTGNASRASYHSEPTIVPTNFYLKTSDMSPEELISTVGSGLYVTEVSGLHAAINPTTADFSVPAKALLIENGEIGGAVDNLTLSGNMLEFFKKIESVGSDLTWVPAYGMIGVPTVFVSDIKVTGSETGKEQ